MRDLAKHVLFLVVMGGGCGGLWHFANAITKADIDTNRLLAQQQLLTELVGSDKFVDLDVDSTPAGDCTNGLLLKQIAPGYAGPIEFLIYQRISPEVLRIRAVAHRETPGIGDFIDSRRDDYLPAKDKYTVLEWRALDGVTGATVTSAALRTAVWKALVVVSEKCGGDI